MQSQESQREGVLVKTSTPGIYRKGSRYIVVFRDMSGRQRKRSAKTLAEARTLKAALTADVKRSEYVEESGVSLADYARHWIETYDGRTVRGIRPGTLRGYRRELALTRPASQPARARSPTSGGCLSRRSGRRT